MVNDSIDPIIWLFTRFCLAIFVGLVALGYSIVTIVTNSFTDLVCAVSESIAFIGLVW